MIKKCECLGTEKKKLMVLEMKARLFRGGLFLSFERNI